MNDKELLLKEIQGLIDDSQKENVDKKTLEARIEAINKTIAEKLDNNGMKDLKESVDKLVAANAENAAAINAMTEQAKKDVKEKPTTFKQALIDAVVEHGKNVPGLVVERKDENGERKSIQDYLSKLGHQSTGEMIVKTEMLESSIAQPYVPELRLTELDPNRVGIPLTIYPHVTDWMPSKPISRPNMALLVVYTYVAGEATKVEGSASTISSFLLKTISFKAFFIATFFTLSDETLDDLEEAMAEIAVTAPSKILDKIDYYVLGTAGDDSSAIGGLFSASCTPDKFTAFTGYTGTTPNANKVDVIAKMKLQCKKNKYIPDTVLINATDIEALAAEKDQLDNSKFDRRLVYNALGEPVAICGMRLILSEYITADTVAVLDSRQLMIGKRKDLTMEIGYNAADFTEGQKTVVLKVRLAFGCRDGAAVIYCSGLDAAVTDINVS